jgi:hypothetical protein
MISLPRLRRLRTRVQQDQGSIASTTHTKGMTMKKTVLRATALVMTAFLGVAGVTQIAQATDKWTNGKIGVIVVNPNAVLFALEGYPPLCASASGDGTGWVTLTTNYNSAEAIRNYLSIVTAAKLAGREVQVRGVNSNVPDEWGCRMDAIDLW